MTYAGLPGPGKKGYAQQPSATHDNCCSSLSKIYDEHATLVIPDPAPGQKPPPDAVRRGLEFPLTYSTRAPRNWGRYAVGTGGEYWLLSQEWLKDNGWEVTRHQDDLR